VATITSRQHALVKEFRRVARGDARLALLDGWHLLDDAVRARVNVRTVAVATGAIPAGAERILGRARDAGAAVYEVAPRVLEALSPVRTPTGVVSLVERRAATFPQLLTPSPPLVVVAVDMQDPGNVGAVIRSSEAGGATGVIFAGASADPWGWKALRAAMGSTFRLPAVTASDVSQVVADLRHAGVLLVASVPRGGTPMHTLDLRAGLAIIIGGEGPGLPSDIVARADARVTVPMKPPVESLNAAVAAALLVYEARRQREVRA
jgi:TrmH family RNA methyltransferase